MKWLAAQIGARLLLILYGLLVVMLGAIAPSITIDGIKESAKKM